MVGFSCDCLPAIQIMMKPQGNQHIPWCALHWLHAAVEHKSDLSWDRLDWVIKHTVLSVCSLFISRSWRFSLCACPTFTLSLIVLSIAFTHGSVTSANRHISKLCDKISLRSQNGRCLVFPLVHQDKSITNHFIFEFPVFAG